MLNGEYICCFDQILGVAPYKRAPVSHISQTIIDEHDPMGNHNDVFNGCSDFMAYKPF